MALAAADPRGQIVLSRGMFSVSHGSSSQKERAQQVEVV